jgi:hypothetical protein
MAFSEPTQAPTTSREEWLYVVAEHARASGQQEFRRSNQRFPASGQAVLSLEKADGEEELSLSGRIVEVSSTGLMLICLQNISSGRIAVTATFDGVVCHLVGRSMHCTSTVGGYKIGVHLDFEEGDADDSEYESMIVPEPEPLQHRPEVSAQPVVRVEQVEENQPADEPYSTAVWLSTALFFGAIGAIAYTIGSVLISALR